MDFLNFSQEKVKRMRIWNKEELIFYLRDY